MALLICPKKHFTSKLETRAVYATGWCLIQPIKRGVGILASSFGGPFEMLGICSYPLVI